ncbi:MAG: hypothetical protein ACKVP4_05520 [Hyphomicrobium sp.]
MFSLKRVGRTVASPRLISTETLTPTDFSKLSKDLGAAPLKARKSGFVSARAAKQRQTIETLWNGKETTVPAEPGDMIVTNMNADREILRDAGGNANTYVIRAARFPELYERATGNTDFGEIYRARGVVEALFVPGGFEIMAPWGEMQRADSGYILKSGDEVYGNNKETFEKTYEVLA